MNDFQRRISTDNVIYSKISPRLQHNLVRVVKENKFFDMSGEKKKVTRLLLLMILPTLLCLLSQDPLKKQSSKDNMKL